MGGKDLKARVGSEWKEYKEANPEASKSREARFMFHNEKMKEWYEEADTAKKEEVEEFRKRSKSDLEVEGEDDCNRKFQE